MANPTVVTITAGTWTKVATAATSGAIRILDHGNDYWFYTVETGDPAPSDPASGAPQNGAIFEGASMMVDAASPLDVYIFRTSGGRVRFDAHIGMGEGGGGVPASARWASATLADVTGGSNGTYDYYTDMRGFTRWMAHFTRSGTIFALRVYATGEDVAAATSVTEWENVTFDMFGLVSISSSGIYADNAGVLADATWVKFELTLTGIGTRNWRLLLNKHWE